MTGKFEGHVYHGDGDAETATGSAAQERFYGEGGNDRFDGAGGNDVIDGDDGNDILRGGDGDDILQDGLGRDVLFGGAGDDRLELVYPWEHVGNTFDGGEGNDTLGFSPSYDEASTFVITLSSIKRDGTTLVTATSMESLYVWLSDGMAARVTGGSHDDWVFTDADGAENDIVRTLGGNDVVFVGGGADTVVAGEGNDFVAAYLGGQDAIDTGNGDDKLSLTGMFNAGTVDGNALYDLGSGNDTITFYESANATFNGTTLRLDGVYAGKVIGWEKLIYEGSFFSTTFRGTSHVDDIRMGYGDDTAGGSGGNDVIQGGLGDDTLDGGAGTDTIDFSDKNADHGYATPVLTITLNGASDAQAIVRDGRRIETDTFKNFENVVGGDGTDRITGNAAANVLDGGLGYDVLKGLAGSDVFVFSDALAPGDPLLRSDIDRILDFSSADDSIRLSKHRFENLTGNLKTGELDANQFKDITGGGVKIDADDRIIYNQTTGRLYYDPDGSGAAARVQFALIENHASLSSHDFFVA